MSDQDPNNSEPPLSLFRVLFYLALAMLGLIFVAGGAHSLSTAYNTKGDIIAVGVHCGIALLLLLPTLKLFFGKNFARKIRNRGLLAIVGLGFVLSIVLPPLPPAVAEARQRRAARTQEKSRRRMAEKQRLRVEKQKRQQAADTKKKRQREQRAARGHSDVRKLMDNLRKIGVDESVIVRGSYTEIGRTATLTVGNSWHYDAYQIRLQAAQNLWGFWVDIHSPDDRDQARILLVDLNGNEVGGSRLIAGSMIWVAKD